VGEKSAIILGLILSMCVGLACWLCKSPERSDGGLPKWIASEGTISVARHLPDGLGDLPLPRMFRENLVVVPQIAKSAPESQADSSGSIPASSPDKGGSVFYTGHDDTARKTEGIAILSMSR
jgi:hypothetical protein